MLSPVIVNPYLQTFLQTSRGFELVLSEDGKCAFASTKEGFRRFRFDSTSDEPPIKLVAYRDQRLGGFYFYRSDFRPPERDKRVEVIIDRAWGSSNSNILVVSAHLPYKPTDQTGTMFMVRMEWDHPSQSPFVSVELEYKGDQEPRPIGVSVNLDDKARPAWYWWGPCRIQPQPDRQTFSLYLSPAEDNSAWMVGSMFLPKGRFDRYCDGINLACGFDFAKSQVTFASGNSTTAQTVDCPTNTGASDLTAKGIVVETYDGNGRAKELFRLDGQSRWVSLGSVLFEGKSATGELSLTKDITTGELTLSKI